MQEREGERTLRKESAALSFSPPTMLAGNKLGCQQLFSQARDGNGGGRAGGR